MKLIRIKTPAAPEVFLDTVRDNRIVNAGVRFGEDGAVPTAEVKEKKGRVRIRCRMVGGASQDNGFFFGTYFTGRLRRTDGGGCELRGIILTEPIVHIIWFFVVLYFVIKCFEVGGVSLIPVFLSLLVYFMFRPEYKKQSRLARYLARAASRCGASARGEDGV